MKRQHIIKVLAYLLPKALHGYSIQRNYSPAGLATTIDFVASVVSDSSAIKKLFIQVSDQPLLETINTHAILKHELTEKGVFKEKDEYWLVLSEEATPELNSEAEKRHIKLLDKTWLKGEVAENMDKSRQLRETVETLESIGIPI